MIQKPYFNPEVFETPFINQFSRNIDMLNYRSSRMWEIDTFNIENQQEYLMTFDATLAIFRAMFLEKREDNYTFQNYYRKTGRPEVAEKIDAFLDTPFMECMDASIRKVLKFIADKFVCHVDKVDNTDIGLCNAWMNDLCNPYFSNNFRHVMDELNAIIESAPAIEI